MTTLTYNIDWSKVKKSPMPKSFDGDTFAWYRGSGIKIAVSPGVLTIVDS